MLNMIACNDGDRPTSDDSSHSCIAIGKKIQLRATIHHMTTYTFIDMISVSASKIYFTDFSNTSVDVEMIQCFAIVSPTMQPER